MGGRSESTGSSPESGAGARVGVKVARTRPQPSSLEFQIELQSLSTASMVAGWHSWQHTLGLSQQDHRRAPSAGALASANFPC